MEGGTERCVPVLPLWVLLSSSSWTCNASLVLSVLWRSKCQAQAVKEQYNIIASSSKLRNAQRELT